MHTLMRITWILAAAGLVTGTTLIGCAKTKSDVVQGYHGQERLPRPERILVYDFAVSPHDVSVNSAIGARIANFVTGTSLSEEQRKIGRAVANVLAEELVNQFEQRGFTAQRATKAEPPPTRTLAIEGQFVTIDEGNRLRRMVIGFGVGGTKCVHRCKPLSARPPAVCCWRNSSQMPKVRKNPGMGPMVGVGGAVSSVGTAAVLSTGVGAVTELDQTVEGDARRTAQEIAKQLSVFFAKEGWITAP